MDKQNRKAIIAGNWKMNKTATEAKALINELIPAVKDAGCEVVICVPFTDLVTAVEMTKGTNIPVSYTHLDVYKRQLVDLRTAAEMATAETAQPAAFEKPFADYSVEEVLLLVLAAVVVGAIVVGFVRGF